MFERFTTDAKAAVIEAQQVARSAGATQVEPAHLALAIIATPAGAGCRILVEIGVDLVRAGAELVDRANRSGELGGLTVADVDALSSLGVDATGLIERLGVPARGADAGRSRRRWRRLRHPDGESRHLRFTQGAKAALERSLRETLKLRHNSIGSEHLLLGVVAVDPDVRAVLEDHGASYVNLVEQVARSRATR
jgi:ATP-dependent Clp protease ATP-binding subunit ClpA